MFSAKLSLQQVLLSLQVYDHRYKAFVDGVETDSVMEIDPHRRTVTFRTGNGSKEIVEVHDFKNASTNKGQGEDFFLRIIFFMSSAERQRRRAHPDLFLRLANSYPWSAQALFCRVTKVYCGMLFYKAFQHTPQPA